jgi:hypothetical protein
MLLAKNPESIAVSFQISNDYKLIFDNCANNDKHKIAQASPRNNMKYFRKSVKMEDGGGMIFYNFNKDIFSTKSAPDSSVFCILFVLEPNLRTLHIISIVVIELQSIYPKIYFLNI